MKTFNFDEYLKKVEDIVNIDSGSRMPEGTNAVADYMEAQYRELGLSVVRHVTSTEVGPCLEIRNRPEEERINILLVGHMDTVFPAGTVAKRPYKREGNRAYGPGVIDMKSGLISILYLVKEMLENNLDISFCVAMNSDEEISSNHSKEWLKELARKSDYAIVMEPGRKNGEYVNGRKGLARFHVEFKGIPAHAGIAPQDGASAIHEMARLIQEIIKLINYEKGTSVNVGLANGGTSANVVSEYADCMIDTRFDDISEYEKIDAELKRLSENPQNPRVAVTYKREGFRPPMNMTKQTEKLAKWMEEEGVKAGVDVKWVRTGGVSDANFISFEGCPVVDGAGPAGEGSHSANEILQLDTVENRLELLWGTMIRISEERVAAL